MALTHSSTLPWTNDVAANLLDLRYYGNHSGYKLVSPLVEKEIDTSTHTIIGMSELSELIYSAFINKWTRLYDTINLAYNPINNYDMTETETTTGENEKSETITHNTTDMQTNTGTNETATNGTHTGTPEITETVNNSKNTYGYNSASAVPTDTENNTKTTSGAMTTDITDTETETLNTTNTVVKSGTDGTIENATNTVSRTLTSNGNIGVTTTQQMIESERKIDNWDIFEAVVFADVDNILTLKIY